MGHITYSSKATHIAWKMMNVARPTDRLRCPIIFLQIGNNVSMAENFQRSILMINFLECKCLHGALRAELLLRYNH